MCTYLDKVGSTYYFRRPVPNDLLGRFTTARGKPRTEWKFSLRTKDKEQAKRLLRPYVTDTDKLIDDARAAVTPPAPPRSAAQLARDRARWEWEREQEALEYAAASDIDNEIEALEPIMDAIEAGTVPDASPADIARAGQLLARHEREMGVIRVEEEANKRRPRPSPAELLEMPTAGKALSTDASAVSLTDLFERYAKSGTANVKTVRRWRKAVAVLVEHLGHDDVTKVTRADLNGWTAALVAKGLTKKTVVDGYLPAIRAALVIAHDDGLIPTNPADGLKVRAPKAVTLRERDLTDDEAATILSATLLPQPVRWLRITLWLAVGFRGSVLTPGRVSGR